MKLKSARRDANLTEFVRNCGHVLAPDALSNIRQLAERKNISVLLDLAKHNTKTCQRQHLLPSPDGSPRVTPARCTPPQRETLLPEERARIAPLLQ